MPRILVTTDSDDRAAPIASVLLDEHVHSVHLSTSHAATQLIERVAWAVSDAERVERAGERRAPGASPLARPVERSRQAVRGVRTGAGGASARAVGARRVAA